MDWRQRNKSERNGRREGREGDRRERLVFSHK
jgi:hypothetical protein